MLSRQTIGDICPVDYRDSYADSYTVRLFRAIEIANGIAIYDDLPEHLFRMDSRDIYLDLYQDSYTDGHEDNRYRGSYSV